MEFRPEVGDPIFLDLPLFFTEHPAAPGLPYGQKGRRGTVYQVEVAADHSLHALKVFTDFFQDERNALSAARLASFAGMPGLQACYRKVIIPQRYPDLIQAYPQLLYGVMMPWIHGDTWCDLVNALEPLYPDQCLLLARDLVGVLIEMEKRAIAHCDLSGANLLLTLNPIKVNLVDVEEIYSPDLVSPDSRKLPAGTPGYAHATAAGGLWNRYADRFAGAVLIAEFLGWSSESVRQKSYEYQYFDQKEVQTNSPRFQLLRETIRRLWGRQTADAFSHAWFSQQLENCPSFSDWISILNGLATAAPQQPAAAQSAAPFESPAAPPTLVEQTLVEPPGAGPHPADATLPADDVPTPEATLVDPNPPTPRLEAVYNPAQQRAGAQPSAGRTALPNVRQVTSGSPYQAAKNRIAKNPLLRKWMFAFPIVVVIAVLAAVTISWVTATPRGTASLTGTVIDHATRSGVSAEVVARVSGHDYPAKSDSSGAYTIADLPAGEASLLAQIPGYASTPLPVTLTADTHINAAQIDLYLVAAVVKGTVQDANSQPLGGVTLQVLDTATGKEIPVANPANLKTAQDGSFAFALKEPATIQLKFNLRGYLTLTSDPVKAASGKVNYLETDPVHLEKEN